MPGNDKFWRIFPPPGQHKLLSSAENQAQDFSLVKTTCWGFFWDLWHQEMINFGGFLPSPAQHELLSSIEEDQAQDFTLLKTTCWGFSVISVAPENDKILEDFPMSSLAEAPLSR